MIQETMMKLQVKLSKKQLVAYKILQDSTTTELFYGGAAGGGKSWLGCTWLTLMSWQYPGTRWLLGRAKLKILKQSTLLSLFEVLRSLGLKADVDYNYNTTDGTVKFSNGSEIYLKDLFFYPKDPEFDSLGSTEYTGAYIDEASEITNKAKTIVTSRLRYKLDLYGLIPKILITSNPSKNFIYSEFYKPWKAGTMKDYRKVVIALVQDNPYISPHYVENLKKLDKVSKERLYYGNFEYDDDPARLMEYDDIMNIFTNQYVFQTTEKSYLSVDVARFGRDRAVITLWNGYYIKKLYVYEKSSMTFLEDKILALAAQHHIPRSQIVIDEDGVGGGLVDRLPGVKGFVGGSKPIDDKAEESQETKRYFYRNLRAQCYFKLAEMITNNLIGCYADIPITWKEEIVEELEQVKRKDVGKDGALTIVGKDVIKEMIGRSPDFADTLMMRMLFVVDTKKFLFGVLE